MSAISYKLSEPWRGYEMSIGLASVGGDLRGLIQGM